MKPRSSDAVRPKPAARRLIIGTALILLSTAWVYFPAIRGGWIWDDAEEVPGNPVLRDPAGLGSIWTAPSGSDYFPLKTSFQWLEWHLWGEQVAGYHLANVALHALSALLLWRILWKLGLRSAWLGGLLFAVHPLAVESVAWISELKNTLSLPLILLAFDAYIDFDAGLGRRWGVVSWAWFVLAMLAKSSVAMFPFVLLLYAWWRRGRIGPRDLGRAAPFFAVSLGLGAVTLWFQANRALAGQDIGLEGLWLRVAGAGRVVLFYFLKCLIPVGLMPVYPRWGIEPAAPVDFLPWLLLAAGAAWMWRRRRAWGRHAILGFGFFAINLVPVLGIAPMAYLRLSWVADHLAYVSLAGAAGLAAAGFDRWARTPPWKALAWSAAAVAAAALAGASRLYAGVFQSDEGFWAYAAGHNPRAWIAHGNLGLALFERGEVGEATRQYREALRLKPDFEAAHVNLGNALARAGKPTEAAQEYEQALRARPDDTDALTDLGNLALAAGRFGEAADRYEAVLRLHPADPAALRSGAEAHYRNANALGNAGRVAEAAAEYRQALRLWPRLVQARANLGLALSTLGRRADALAELEEAVRQKPDYAEARAYLGLALAGSGRLEEAIAQYQEALRLDPGAGEVHYQLALALKGAGRTAEAEGQFEAAARLGGRP